MSKSKKGKPFLPEIETFIKAGINPKTKLPIKFDDLPDILEDKMRTTLRIMDEQDACNRYVWSGIPMNLTSQEIERLLYYKGQLCFFYFEELDEFYLMPYALDGTIDFYGRYNTVKPVPMTSGSTEIEETKRYKEQSAILGAKSLKVVYAPVEEDFLEKNADGLNVCVLLHDYTKQLAQEQLPRQQIQEGIIKVMAECIPFMRTSLIAGSGIQGMRVADGDQQASVKDANNTLVRHAKNGELYVPILGPIEFQDLTKGQPITSSEYMLAMQSLDNMRKSVYGIENGGLFEKKAHELEKENDLNLKSCMNQLQDGLAIRQHFCMVVNSLFGLGMWCDVSENVIQQDLDGDGVAYDEDGGEGQSGMTDSNDGGNENE